MNTELANRETIASLCAAWTECEKKIREGFAAIAAAEQQLASRFEGHARWISVRYNGNSMPWEEPDRIIVDLKKQVWAALAERLELRSILSLQRIAELDKQLETGEGLPDITYPNIIAVLEQNLNNFGQFLEEKVLEVYEWLRPHSSSYVTNQKSMEAGVGRKVIKGWSVERSYRDGKRCYCLRYGNSNNYRALDQVFHYLDGKPVHPSYYGELYDAVQAQTDGAGKNTAETPYFKVRCFANGNLHLEFKRKDLLDRFNLIAGGARLNDTKAAI